MEVGGMTFVAHCTSGQANSEKDDFLNERKPAIVLKVFLDVSTNSLLMNWKFVYIVTFLDVKKLPDPHKYVSTSS